MTLQVCTRSILIAAFELLILCVLHLFRAYLLFTFLFDFSLVIIFLVLAAAYLFGFPFTYPRTCCRR